MITPVIVKTALVVKAGLVVGVLSEMAAIAVAQAAQAVTLDPTLIWVAAITQAGVVLVALLGLFAAVLTRREVGKVHTLVNSSDAAKSKIIAELTAKVEQMHRDLLARADASLPRVSNEGEER